MIVRDHQPTEMPDEALRVGLFAGQRCPQLSHSSAVLDFDASAGLRLKGEPRNGSSPNRTGRGGWQLRKIDRHGFSHADFNPQQLNGLRLYPDFGARRVRTSQGNSAYHSLQARLDRRFAHGLQLEASYTWSKSIDSTSEGTAQVNAQYASINLTSVPVAQGGLKLDRGLSDFHRGQRLTSSTSGKCLELPAGRGSKFWVAGPSPASRRSSPERPTRSSTVPTATSTASTRWIVRTSATQGRPCTAAR
jgi:hypothetical protein